MRQESDTHGRAAESFLRRNGQRFARHEVVSGDRHVLVTADGTIWEVDPDDAAITSGECPDCAGDAVANVLAREHPSCGYVTTDGFVGRDGSIRCPKCDSSPTALPVVATVRTCLTCGRALGSP